ncbi:MAG: Xaa-Pro peptidase family protein [Treponema sp.]|jgi:Xaa-Pro dipeptidase|nr:Xaa-Pro peptidase family protein [Treponema sp.]
MTAKTKEELEAFYKTRREKLTGFMKDNAVTAVVFEDTEERRDPAVRYFTGHPGDALFIITADNRGILVPWDENLAKKQAVVETIEPYSKFDRKNIKAVKEILDSLRLNGRLTAELSPETPYPLFLKYVDALSGWDVRCREESVHDYVKALRAVKDDYEIECTKEAARIGDMIIDTIEAQVKSGAIKTEADVALLIEKECRAQGCEKTGFDTLAAGPTRSYAIHCFPNYTNGSWPGEGLSILDFGVVYNGYTSDTTLTIAQGNLTKVQEELLELVQKAADEAVKLYKKDIPIRDAAVKADEVFAKAKQKMPHTLGHGIGLEIHEFPTVRPKNPSSLVFAPGMIVTLEPGLYDTEAGGVRLENDVLITETGNEIITHSRIIRI